MDNERPQSISKYKEWLREEHDVEISDTHETHYNSVTSVIKRDFENSPFWTRLVDKLRDFNAEYLTT